MRQCAEVNEPLAAQPVGRFFVIPHQHRHFASMQIPQSIKQAIQFFYPLRHLFPLRPVQLMRDACPVAFASAQQRVTVLPFCAQFLNLVECCFQNAPPPCNATCIYCTGVLPG